MNSSYKVPARHWFWYFILSSVVLILVPFVEAYFSSSVPSGFSVERFNMVPGPTAIFGGPLLVLLLTIIFLHRRFAKEVIVSKKFLTLFTAWICLLFFTVLCVETYGFYLGIEKAKGSFLISPGSFGGAVITALGTYGVLWVLFFLISRAEEFLLKKKHQEKKKKRHWTSLIVVAIVVLLIGGISWVLWGDPLLIFVLICAPLMLFFGPIFVFMPTAVIFSIFLCAMFVFFAYLNWIFLTYDNEDVRISFRYLSGKMLLCLIFFWCIHFMTLTSLFPLRTSSPFFFM